MPQQKSNLQKNGVQYANESISWRPYKTVFKRRSNDSIKPADSMCRMQ